MTGTRENHMQDFDDIRPYRDDEVPAVIAELRKDPDLPRAMARFRLPSLSRWMPVLANTLTRWELDKQLSKLRTVHDVQLVIEKYLSDLIETRTTGLTTSGLDKLDPAKSYLFISNHRDITMDPALVNYMLYHNGFQTVEIAIGDNLLKRPFLSHLMKLNKSFLVKRGVQGRDLLQASKQLSAYIAHCVRVGNNVWIAQREGRAKDGVDKTETAVIKMLQLASRELKDEQGNIPSLAEHLSSLHIVPVAISYGLDPCDEMKARELHAIDSTGSFKKDDNSDVNSILAGMIGKKGKVHVSFGEELKLCDQVTAEGVAELIDEQIIQHYQLHTSNYLALQILKPDFLDFSVLPEYLGISKEALDHEAELLKNRFELMPVELRPYALSMYANPAIRKAERQLLKCR
jgi:1-acyl-sn-glycerol-3-phosphate acyltransferase